MKRWFLCSFPNRSTPNTGAGRGRSAKLRCVRFSPERSSRVITTGCLIEGEELTSGDVLEVRNPYNGELVGEVHQADAADVERALAAGSSYRSELTRYHRSEILTRARQALQERAQELRRGSPPRAGSVFAKPGTRSAGLPMCCSLRRSKPFVTMDRSSAATSRPRVRRADLYHARAPRFGGRDYSVQPSLEPGGP